MEIFINDCVSKYFSDPVIQKISPCITCNINCGNFCIVNHHQSKNHEIGNEEMFLELCGCNCKRKNYFWPGVGAAMLLLGLIGLSKMRRRMLV